MGRNHKPIPDYEKPLVKTGEARLWRKLNSGDRVEVVHKETYSKRGTIDARTCAAASGSVMSGPGGYL
jgi:hypothetical protein